MNQSRDLQLSIVVPVLNEAGNIGPLIERTARACRDIPHEIIVVNDGSTDGTADEVRRRLPEIKSLRLINFRGNFGQTAAMAAGINAAAGDFIVPLDGDGQNDPDDIPRFLRKAKEGFDVVSGWRQDRQDPFLSRKVPSWCANAMISWVTGVSLHDYGCTLKAYRAEVIKDVRLFGEMHRFLPAWCAWRGGKVVEMPAKHHARTIGRSKYGIFRTFKVVIDLMTFKFFSGYLAKPNYLFSGIGLILAFLSFLSAAYAFFDKFGPDQFAKFRIPLLLLSLFFGLVAVALFSLGLVAEIIIRLYYSINNQLPYVVASEERA